MDRTFNIGKSEKTTNESSLLSLEEMSLEDKENLFILFAALERLLKMRGKKMSDLLWQERMRIQDSLGEDGLFKARNRQNSRELDEALDILEIIEKGRVGSENDLTMEESISSKIIEKVEEQSKAENIEPAPTQEGTQVSNENIQEQSGAEKFEPAFVQEEVNVPVEKVKETIQEEPLPETPGKSLLEDKIDEEVDVDINEPIKISKQAYFEEPKIDNDPVEEKNMKFCQNCGKENPITANFCEYCGNKYAKAVEDKPASPINEPAYDNIEIQPVEERSFEEPVEEIPNNEGSPTEQVVLDNNPSEEVSEEDLSFEDQLRKVLNNENALISFLDSIDGIEDEGKSYSSAELKSSIKKAFDELSGVKIGEKEAIKNALSRIPEAGGLREKVHRIYVHNSMKGQTSKKINLEDAI